MLTLKRQSMWVTRYAEIKDCIFIYKDKQSKKFNHLTWLSWYETQIHAGPSNSFHQARHWQKWLELYRDKKQIKWNLDDYLWVTSTVQTMGWYLCRVNAFRRIALQSASSTKAAWTRNEGKRRAWQINAESASDVQRQEENNQVGLKCSLLWIIH